MIYTALNLPVAVARKEKCAQSFFFFLRVTHFNNQRVNQLKSHIELYLKSLVWEYGVCASGLCMGEIPLTKSIRKME